MKKITYIVVAFVFFACTKSEEPTIIIQKQYKSYAGLKLNRYTIFDVVRIEHSIFKDETDTLIYEMKHEFTDVFTDLEGEEALRQTISVRNIGETTWITEETRALKITNMALEVVEDNERYRNLLFPVKLNVTWDGNSMNFLPQEDYKYTKVHQELTINGNSLDSVVTVIQRDDEYQSIISREYKEEQYASNIGLVYRKEINIEKTLNSATGNFDLLDGYEEEISVKYYGER